MEQFTDIVDCISKITRSLCWSLCQLFSAEKELYFEPTRVYAISHHTINILLPYFLDVEDLRKITDTRTATSFLFHFFLFFSYRYFLIIDHFYWYFCHIAEPVKFEWVATEAYYRKVRSGRCVRCVRCVALRALRWMESWLQAVAGFMLLKSTVRPMYMYCNVVCPPGACHHRYAPCSLRVESFSLNKIFAELKCFFFSTW